MIRAIQSGVDRVAIGLPCSTLDSRKLSITLVPAFCPGWIGLYARARAYACKKGEGDFFSCVKGKPYQPYPPYPIKIKSLFLKEFWCLGLWIGLAVFCPGLVFRG